MTGTGKREAEVGVRDHLVGRSSRRVPVAEARRVVSRARRSRPVTAFTTAAKVVLRRWGVLTAGLRPPPDFLIVGTKRGGTTSLHDYLLQHPGVLPLFPSPQKVKGVYFFDEGWARGVRWYRSHFPSRLARRIAARRLGYEPLAGEATPYYLFHPLAPTRARTVVPDARIVVLLRDPVERAFSHYKERLNHTTEPLDFVAAIAAEHDRLAGEEERIVAEPGYVSVAHRHQSYVAQGRYLEGLRRWLAAYPAEQVLVLRSEDLFSAPGEVYAQVLRHLGLPPRPLEDPRHLNAEPSPDMDEEIRERLENELRSEVAELESFLGRDLGWTIP